MRIDPSAFGALPEGERAAALERLELLRRLYSENPLELFRPHVKQVPFLGHVGNGTRSFFFGGNRSGKTTAGVVKGLVQAVPRDLVPEHLQRFKFWDGPTRGRVVTPDFKQSHEVIIDKFKQWVPRQALRGGGTARGDMWWKNAYDSQARRLWFKSGSWIEFMSQEQDVDAFSAQDLHWVHFDEEPPYDLGRKQWTECMARLIDYDGSAWMSMTPLFGMSWVHDQYYVPFSSGEPPALDDEDVLITEVSSDENPHVSERGLQRFFKSLGAISQEELASRRHGSFVAFEGMIYPAWDSRPGGAHVVPPLERLPPVGPERRIVGETIDPGARFPAVLLAFADDQGRVTFFDELRFSQGTPIEAVCERIKDARKAWGYVPSFSVIDPAARNRSDQTGRSTRDEYAKHGVPARPGNNTFSVGIGRMRALMEAPGFFRVSEACTEFRREVLKYRWKGSKRAEDAPREGPVKRDDHSLDAARYWVMALPEPDLTGSRKAVASLAADFPVPEPSEGVYAAPEGPGVFA